jgi:hypothetical protein
MSERVARVVAALVNHAWNPALGPKVAHSQHDFHAACALCMAEAERIAEVAVVALDGPGGES